MTPITDLSDNLNAEMNLVAATNPGQRLDHLEPGLSWNVWDVNQSDSYVEENASSLGPAQTHFQQAM
jgi:hypothetical protein